MKRLTLIPWLLLLSACTLPFGQAATPELPALPPTQVGIALPPAWTPTPQGAAQSTARPTSRPAQEPTPTSEIKVTALRLSELPTGYGPAQPVAYGISPAILAAGVLEPQAIAMFEQLGNGTLVISVAAPLATPTEEQGFGSWLKTPTMLLEALAGAMGQLEGSARALDGFSDIGTASAAVEGTILIGGARYTTQIVLLRQGSAAAYIAVLLPRGAQPGFDLQSVVRGYAERLRAEALGIPTPSVP
ncbi:MAG: hypothetical protein NTU91_07565 [Chloroflexi bacterium]|nr:hypothetical protein [Chloroflexota bacterium]